MVTQKSKPSAADSEAQNLASQAEAARRKNAAAPAACIVPAATLQGFPHQQVRKPLFCKRIRPRAPLARLIG